VGQQSEKCGQCEHRQCDQSSESRYRELTKQEIVSLLELQLRLALRARKDSFRTPFRSPEHALIQEQIEQLHAEICELMAELRQRCDQETWREFLTYVDLSGPMVRSQN
jgi:hypothetical protein